MTNPESAAVRRGIFRKRGPLADERRGLTGPAIGKPSAQSLIEQAIVVPDDDFGVSTLRERAPRSVVRRPELLSRRCTAHARADDTNPLLELGHAATQRHADGGPVCMREVEDRWIDEEPQTRRAGDGSR